VAVRGRVVTVNRITKFPNGSGRGGEADPRHFLSGIINGTKFKRPCKRIGPNAVVSKGAKSTNHAKTSPTKRKRTGGVGERRVGNRQGQKEKSFVRDNSKKDERKRTRGENKDP